MRKLAVVLMITGVLVAYYPYGEWVYREYRQQVALDNFVASLQNIFEKEVAPEEAAAAETVAEALPGNIPANSPYAIGILVIEKIGLRIPLYREISPGNLKTDNLSSPKPYRSTVPHSGKSKNTWRFVGVQLR
jgi:hypothetical protein